MFRRHCIAAKVSDFGLRDLRAKGATDEYHAGRTIRELQHLLGHKSVRTTETYLKELIPETVVGRQCRWRPDQSSNREPAD